MNCTRALCLLSACFLFISGARASVIEVAKELHGELNIIDRQTMPTQLTRLVLQVQPQYRSRELQIKGMYLEIFESKEYENLRVEYFTKAFSEQQLKELVDLAKNPVFKLYQVKMNELSQSSGTALMKLAQSKLSQFDSPSLKLGNAANNSDRRTFYSEDYGNFFINAWMYFDQQTERLYKLSLSVKKIQGSGYSYFLFCAARKFANANGFAGWVLRTESDADDQKGIIGFYKKGENVVDTLGKEFSNSELTDANNEAMASFCIKAEEQARARNSQNPNQR